MRLLNKFVQVFFKIFSMGFFQNCSIVSFRNYSRCSVLKSTMVFFFQKFLQQLQKYFKKICFGKFLQRCLQIHLIEFPRNNLFKISLGRVPCVPYEIQTGITFAFLSGIHLKNSFKILTGIKISQRLSRSPIRRFDQKLL